MRINGELMSTLRLFTFTFGSGYYTQQAVVMAANREEAIALITQRTSSLSMRDSYHRFIDIARDKDTNEILVTETNEPIVLTFGMDG